MAPDTAGQLQADNTITITVSRHAAEHLEARWFHGDSDPRIVAAVRDLLDGHDGYLHVLTEALGLPR